MNSTILKIIIRLLISIVFFLMISTVIFTIYTSKTLAIPNGLTLEEEKQWAKNNGVWGNLENYNVEDYTIKCKDDYIINCEFVYNDETAKSNKYVIISHGYNSNRYGAAKYVPVYIELGYNCIIYDLRGHGENEKTFCTIGNYESQDLNKLIDDTYSRYGDDIYLGLHGESMGSSTSLSVLKYNPKIHFVVADCGFADLYELIGKQFEQRKIAFAEPVVDFGIKVRYGYSMKDTSAITAVYGNQIPICFIHGEDDSFIAPDNSQRLCEKTAGYSEIHNVPHAEHAQSRAVLGKSEYKKIKDEAFW